MYAKAANLGSARNMFEEIPMRSPASWIAMTVRYARCGAAGAAMEMFQLILENTVAFIAMIDVFVKSSNKNSSRRLFDEMLQKNVVSWTILSGYCQASDMISVGRLFDEMTEKNLFSWNAMIGGYSCNRQPHKALELFQKLQSCSSLFVPDKITLVSIIPAIATMVAVDLSRWIYGYHTNIVSTALIDMYAKCEDVTLARKIFNSMLRKETVSWNALINGLALN